jgi:hypothetical protein
MLRWGEALQFQGMQTSFYTLHGAWFQLMYCCIAQLAAGESGFQNSTGVFGQGTYEVFWLVEPKQDILRMCMTS